MCRGIEEERKEEYYYLSELDEYRSCCLEDDHQACVCHDQHAAAAGLPSSIISCCELCDSELASVYCQADDAFLCAKCDTRVHAANFLAQRHIRCFLCTDCHSLTNRYLIDVSVQVLLPTIVCKKEVTKNQSNHESSDQATNQLIIRPFLFL